MLLDMQITYLALLVIKTKMSSIGFGPNFAWGIRNVVDAKLNYVRNSNAVYLRTKNPAVTVSDPTLSKLGFCVPIMDLNSPANTESPILDTEIWPSPIVSTVSMREVNASNGKILFGARRFEVSHTWVLAYAQANNITDPAQVFEGSQALGLVTDNRLFSIVNVQPTEGGGGIIMWSLTANATEPVR